MKAPLEITGIVPVGQMRGETREETGRLYADCLRAREFILGQKWCFGIGEVYFGAGLGGVVSVFLIEIEPRPTGVDQWLWVIVGDIPSAYLVTDISSNPTEALENYIDLMEDWASLALLGESSEDVIPVNQEATPENATRLQQRLDCLSKDILPWLRGVNA